MEKALKKRDLQGDRLLDCLDIIEDILNAGGEVTEQAEAVLYHATNESSARSIAEEKVMRGVEDGLFFSTRPDGQISGYGECIVKVKIPVEKLLLDDEFKGELHYRVPLDRQGGRTPVEVLSVFKK